MFVLSALLCLVASNQSSAVFPGFSCILGFPSKKAALTMVIVVFDGSVPNPLSTFKTSAYGLVTGLKLSLVQLMVVIQ